MKTAAFSLFPSLGSCKCMLDESVESIRLLGGLVVGHKQEADALSITCPSEMPFKHAVGFKIDSQPKP